MLAEKTYQTPKNMGFQIDSFTAQAIQIEIIPELEIEYLAANLSPNTPWAERQSAAKKLGQSRHPKALAILLSALQNDPFWMVRCTIIQSLEIIGDTHAIPALEIAAAQDDFSAVRSAAETAIRRLNS